MYNWLEDAIKCIKNGHERYTNATTPADKLKAYSLEYRGVALIIAGAQSKSTDLANVQ
jgi:hypothetical protein